MTQSAVVAILAHVPVVAADLDAVERELEQVQTWAPDSDRVKNLQDERLILKEELDCCNRALVQPLH